MKKKCRCKVKYSKVIKDTCCECYEGGFIDGRNSCLGITQEILLNKIKEIKDILKR